MKNFLSLFVWLQSERIAQKLKYLNCQKLKLLQNVPKVIKTLQEKNALYYLV